MHSPETTILRALIEKDTGFVSGGALAKVLGVSRVTVWQHMEKLRRHGFEFEAVRSRGYRLSQRPATVHRELVLAHLSTRKQQPDLLCHDELDSTNDECARQLAGGRAAPFAIVAQRQTKGRGRFGRAWHSEANGNLYISFAFHPELEPTRMQLFTLWMGVNLCELIANFTRAKPGLKWPNDILFDGRKAGGMLTEARIDSDQIRDLVFGLGLNLMSTREAWPAQLAPAATSLIEHARAPLDINKFAAALIGRVLDAYEQFTRGHYTDLLAERWHRYDILRGTAITLTQGTREIHGTAAGIDDEGSLILRNERGGTERFRAGEVSLRKK